MDRIDPQICYSRPPKKRQLSGVINISRTKPKIIHYDSPIPEFVQEWRDNSITAKESNSEPTEE